MAKFYYESNNSTADVGWANTGAPAYSWDNNGSTAEWYASETQGTPTFTPTATVAALASGGTMAFWTTDTAAHNAADWPSTGYNFSMDITNIGADLTVSLQCHRTFSDLTNYRADSVFSFGSGITGTGVKTHTNQTWSNVNTPTARAASDKCSVRMYANNSNMMSAQYAEVSTHDVDSYMDNSSWTTGGLSVSCQVITASSTLFNPTIINTQEIFLNVLNVPGTVETPRIQPPPQTVQFQVIAASSTVPNPSVVQNIELQVISAPSTLFNPTIVQDVILPVIVTSSTVNNPSVLHRFLISMQVVSASSTIFSPEVNQDIVLNVIGTTSTIPSPALDYNIELNVLNVPGNVFSPATDTSVNIDANLITAASTIFDPALNQDVVTPVVDAPATVPNPLASQTGGAQTINYDVISVASTVFNPSVTTLTTVVAQVLDSPSTVFSPTVVQNIEVQTVVTSSTIFSPSLEQIVELQLVNTSPTIHAPRIGEQVDDGSMDAIINRPGFPPFPIGI